MPKKLISVLLVVLLLVLTANISLAEWISPFAETGCEISANIQFSKGKAQAISTISHVPSGYSVKTSVILQKKSGSSWVSVSSSSGIREACASATAVKGVTYRAYAKGWLYDQKGAFVDSFTATSRSKKY